MSVDRHPPSMDADRYLERIGVDPETVDGPTVDTLSRLQRAHVHAVPFETLAITGDPYSDRAGEGVSLELPALYAKIVERERGGFCFELNGLFGWLLDEVGFDADRVPAQVISDGDPRPPANHHSHLVHLDRPYVVDVGMGTPQMRRPLPLGGATDPDEAGVVWRTVESDRPDADHLVQYRESSDDEWSDRYIFRDEPVDLDYFEATCHHLASAPESVFTGDPTLAIATERGYVTCSPDEVTVADRGEETTRSIDASEWYRILGERFGVDLDAHASTE